MDSYTSNPISSFQTGFEANVNKSIAGNVTLELPVPHIPAHKKKVLEISDCVERIVNLLTKIKN
jgi:hypothetical protein